MRIKVVTVTTNTRGEVEQPTCIQITDDKGKMIEIHAVNENDSFDRDNDPYLEIYE